MAKNGNWDAQPKDKSIKIDPEMTQLLDLAKKKITLNTLNNFKGGGIMGNHRRELETLKKEPNRNLKT